MLPLIPLRNSHIKPVKPVESTLPKLMHCVELLNHNNPPACFHQGETLISSERARKAGDKVNMCLAAAVKIALHRRKKKC